MLASVMSVMFLACSPVTADNGGDDIHEDLPTGDDDTPVDPQEPTGSIIPSDPVPVARVTGRAESGETLLNPNHTDTRFGIGRTDYGNMWETADGRIMCVFGDNFDSYGNNWKSNAIAISDDRDLSDGLYYSEMLMDGDEVKEIVVSRSKTGQYPDGLMHEVTCIPTAGVSVGDRIYLNYMSIRDWLPVANDNDVWAANYSEIVYSDDNGATWTRSGVKWDGESNFVQVAYIREDGMVYMYGTCAGRYGSVYLAKVPENSVLDKSSYLYWDGSGWSGEESAAIPVARGTASEMTVAYNSSYGRYMMMYLSVNQRAIVFRDSASPEGEWSGEKIIMYEDGNALYAPYIHPWFNDGDDLWFVLSHAVPTWNIFLMKATLGWDASGMNLLAEGGFEEHTSDALSYRTMWDFNDAALTSRTGHTGNVSCRFSFTEQNTWTDICTQTVTLKKNTDYEIEAWVRPENDMSEGFYAGVRLPDGRIEDVTDAVPGGEWYRLSHTFDSGDNTSCTVFTGVWGGADKAFLIDDISIRPSE